MIGLGRILAETREARGISLDEAERDTRIAQRYLLALEEEDFVAFPAQVQARGFLRLYATYLGLDADEMLALFPSEGPVDETDGLIHSHGDRIFQDTPAERRFELPSINVQRGPVLLAVGIGAVLLFSGTLGALCASGNERANAELVKLSDSGAVGTYRVPDVREDNLVNALAKLEEAGIRPLVIEVPSDRVAAGLVMQQSPPPNSVVQHPSDVTIIVSRGR
ncbi:MAG: helix-turn-helix domain-containing protein [Dehalococcoidia bacterium]